MKMRARFLGAALAGLLPTAAWAADEAEDTAADEAGGWGVALNTATNGEVTPMRLVPTATWRKGRTQLEAGVGLHPFFRTDQRVLSGELTAKWFPNGTDRTLSLYLVGQLAYLHNQRETFYPTTYHHLFLNGGYGVEATGNGRVYTATHVTGGLTTFARKSENPYPGWEEDRMFSDIRLNLAFQFDVGVRF